MADDNTPSGDGNSNPPQPGEANNAELHKAIEKARMEERTNLRTKIEAAEIAANKANELVKTLTADKAALEATVAKLTDQLNALKTGIKQDGGVDIESAIASAVSAALQRQGTDLQATVETLKQDLARERGAREKAELEQARSRMIADAGGPQALIPELVQGQTIEELQQSIERSKSVFARTVAGVGGGGGGTVSGAGNNPPGSLPVGGSGGSGNPAGGSGTPSISGVRSMSLQDFSKQRAALKQHALAQAKGGK